jgi:GDPmannose 4,6-dehydratase
MSLSLISGIAGQDGAILARQLIEEGGQVVGTVKDGNTDLWRIKKLGILDSIQLEYYDIRDRNRANALFERFRPEFFFSFGAYSSVSDSFEEPCLSISTNIDSVLFQLEAIRSISPETTSFFASSSEVFSGSAKNEIISEGSVFSALSPYGVSRIAGLNLIDFYRKIYGLKLFTGILFPHESPLRDEKFFSSRVISFLLNQRNDFPQNQTPLVLGDLSGARDFGDASQYMTWIRELVKTDKYGNFIFSTGVLTKLEDFVLYAFELKGYILKSQINDDKNCLEYVDQNSGNVLLVSNPNRLGSTQYSYPSCYPNKLFGVIGERDPIHYRELIKMLLAQSC